MVDAAIIRRVVTVNTEHGLHIRPCSLIAKAAQRYSSQVWVQKDQTRVDARRVLELLTLAAGPGAELELQAAGNDAEAVIDELSRLFETNFIDAEPSPVPSA
ncbi:MAG TPA: HPr family phosphocarrier protein [Planctomycetaceae bacterium]|jgi:phosphocarrier protein|nr:HPr family phosphocarrier protein [Planctomycetaceae bacterium]